MDRETPIEFRAAIERIAAGDLHDEQIWNAIKRELQSVLHRFAGRHITRQYPRGAEPEVWKEKLDELLSEVMLFLAGQPDTADSGENSELHSPAAAALRVIPVGKERDLKKYVVSIVQSYLGNCEQRESVSSFFNKKLRELLNRETQWEIVERNTERHSLTTYRPKGSGFRQPDELGRLPRKELNKLGYFSPPQRSYKNCPVVLPSPKQMREAINAVFRLKGTALSLEQLHYALWEIFDLSEVKSMDLDSLPGKGPMPYDRVGEEQAVSAAFDECIERVKELSEGNKRIFCEFVLWIGMQKKSGGKVVLKDGVEVLDIPRSTLHDAIRKEIRPMFKKIGKNYKCTRKECALVWKRLRKHYLHFCPEFVDKSSLQLG